MSTKYYASRTCYEFIKDEQWRGEKTIIHTIESLGDCSAYVLLGMPGIGKTATFKQEADQPDCQYVTARDFITFDIKPEWKNKTLFIDGLDEVRAGKGDVLGSFDEIRKKLSQLGQPCFRLSCREADWYGEIDREELKKVSPDGEIKELFFVELTEENLRQILIENHHKTVSEASSFLENAKRRELTDLIKNPQILEMLVVAVDEGNEWPERKVDVFRLACEKLLLEEWNQTHNIANRNQTPPCENLMRASGMVCAVMLLARKQGFALIRPKADEDYPCISDMAIDRPDHLDLVARTRLFSTRDGHAEYNHRIFAEYLSAYYLSNKIDNEGLPVGRVLALMTGTDGGVVAELRGVYAWLVTLCNKERTMLMERDPLGVVLYGDVSLFDREERLKLLHVLSSHADKRGQSGIDYRRNTLSFGAFCQDDTEQDFRNILEKVDYGNRHQYLIEYVLLSMNHGKKISGLTSALVSLITDDGWRYENRKQALSVLIRFDEDQVLQEVLTDIHLGLIPDPDDDLLGNLLRIMYPNRIKPDQIFNFYHTAKKSNYMGVYWYFWAYDLTEKSTNSQVAELLDNFVYQQVVLSRTGDNFDRRLMIGNLLARGIKNSGDNIGVERLYGWLGLGLDEYGELSFFNDAHVKFIKHWLEQHPEIQKNLIEHHLDKCSNQKDFRRCTFEISDRLFHADLPEDYGWWCLDKAKVSVNENIRRFFFIQSISTLDMGKGNTGISLELIEDAAANNNEIRRHSDKYRVGDIKPEDRNHKQIIKRIREKRDQDKKAYIESIREKLRDIKAGTADRGIFKDLGSIYFGYFIDTVGDTPEERLNHFFQNDSGLVQAILNGLQRFIHREDIPDVTDIFKLNMENKYYVYSHPFRAGINELAKTGIQKLLGLREDKISKALAFYYVDGTDEEPVWYKTLLRERPELVARVYIMCGTTALRAGKTHITGSYQFAFGENQELLARLAALPLLDSFRTRSTSEQLASLYDLLAAALQHADHNRLKQLTEKKLSLKSMDAAQRTLWLAAGFILAPEQFAQRLTEFVSEKEARMNYLSGFLSYRSEQWQPVDKLSLQGVSLLVGLLGPSYAPISISDDDYLSGSVSFDSSEVIMELISRLATFLTDEATDAIESLLQSGQLSKWHSRLRRTLHTQRSAKREAMFRHADLEQVRSALNNGPPANAADLACITRECIRELSDRIKYGNTNDYRQYWVQDKKKNYSERQHENECRNRFLSDLKLLLTNVNVDVANVNVDAQLEGPYVGDRRADIRVSYGGSAGYNIPIEAKCNDRRDLWHGIRKQLIERYTIDPGAHGYGIYLVFWFDYEKTPPHPESGPKPRTPAELEERLNQLLRNDEERKKISVCVVDCTADG